MLLSKFVYVNVVNANREYWSSKGFNISGRIKVPVFLLQNKSNVNVSCRCNICNKKYIQRWYRNHDICHKCTQKQNMLGNTFGSNKRTHEIPEKLHIEQLLSTGGKSVIAKEYSVNLAVVNGWLKHHSIFVEPYKGLKAPIPGNFLAWYTSNKPTKKEIYDKYGVSYPTVRRWFKELNINFKGITSKKELPGRSFMKKLNENMDTQEISEYLGVSRSSVVKSFRKLKIIPKKFGNTGTSKEEQQFFEHLKSLSDDFVFNTKSILGGLELDAYSEKHRIAIEYDGLFWHHDKKDHIKKWRLCSHQGIHLLRINSDEWNNKNSLVKSIVASKFGKFEARLYARNLEVRQIGKIIADEHHDKNHISGFGNSSLNFGLFYGDDMISVMSFARNRYGNTGWELVRFSTKQGIQVVGGAGKLFSVFVKTHNPDYVVTFSDLRFGLGRVYEKIGFKRIKRGIPTYWYYNNRFPGRRFSRMMFQKNKLAKKLQYFDENLSETENMFNNKYFKYWDCGSDHFEWRKK